MVVYNNPAPEMCAEDPFLMTNSGFCSGGHPCHGNAGYQLSMALLHKLQRKGVMTSVDVNTAHWGGDNGRLHHAALIGPLDNNEETMQKTASTLREVTPSENLQTTGF